jgi:NAD(P)-dependent dehydrogenase (short-subunit alcohol dehydrogenase family)
VVVVTGGAAGIGAAIAQELGRAGAYVVTLDPMVTVDGTSRMAETGPTTADRIVAAGGSARASSTSVTDRSAVQELFDGLRRELGHLDAVVNVAGITRPTSFASGTEEDWTAVLHVHLEGYLNVLGAALPIMADQGHGRVLGITSGSGWRPANTGAYGCAKRAVAALTWQLGRATPPGVTVNALSPIAATRMVTGGTTPRATGTTEVARTGGISLGSMPPPENLGPIGAYLAGEEFAWSSGQIVFSGGSELAWLPPPRLLEVCRTAASRSLAHVFDSVVPAVFVPAERAQTTSGGGNPRVGPVFDEGAEVPSSARVRSCLVVTDDQAWGAAVGDALTSRGVTCVGAGAWPGARLLAGSPASDFAGAAGQMALAAKEAEPIDAVVVSLTGDRRDGVRGDSEWHRILDEHVGLPGRIPVDAAWPRAVADYSAQANRPVRLVTLIDATTSGGWSRAQSAAQLARAAHMATSDRVDAFAISVESDEPAERRTAAELAAHLLCHPESAPLSGAELAVGSGWIGLRSHPSPATSFTFGGPAVPSWLNATLRSVITGHPR